MHLLKISSLPLIPVHLLLEPQYRQFLFSPASCKPGRM
jgi:hypothetical protein